MEGRMKEKLKGVKGFSKVQIEESGKIVGDSGWHGPNTVTNTGFQWYLQAHILSAGGYCVRSYALGFGTAPNASHTTLPSEIYNTALGDLRKSVANQWSGSHTAEFYVTFYGSQFNHTNSNSLPVNIQNIGLYGATSSLYEGSTEDDPGNHVFCGNTYATSSWATNQNVNCTYSIQFS
jgi:hypothetical protein